MWNEKITQLLSSHRHPIWPGMPLPLTKHQIVALLGSSLSPNQSQESLPTEVQEALDELQAEGEVIAGSRNRYCMAPPTLLAASQEDVTGLLFRGDRAYLTLAHRALDSQQNSDTSLQIRPQKRRFHWIQERLNQVDIHLLTVEESIETLPKPQLPLISKSRLPWSCDPFDIKNWPNRGDIQRYVPSSEPVQKNRWRYPSRESLKNKELLRIPTGEYLWWEDGDYYELEPDEAILAMFSLDAEMKCPLKISWDEPQGRLNLQGVYLPSAFARWLWRLSESDREQYRTRYFQSSRRPLVKQAFKRLGCLLV